MKIIVKKIDAIMKIFSLRTLSTIGRPKMLKSVSEKDEDNFKKIEGIKKFSIIFKYLLLNTDLISNQF